MNDIPEVPVVAGETALYVWIISILVLVVIGLVVMYERKLTAVTTRLNQVIDDSIDRMEKKSDSEQTGLTRINDMLVKLKEIVVIASRRG